MKIPYEEIVEASILEEGQRCGKKTDNKQIDMKLELREQILGRAGIKACRVLDLFAGRGEIWWAMRSRVNVVEYVPCDKTPRMPGTIRGDSTDERFLAAFDMQKFNVVDIDTYGEPWRPYRHQTAL